MVETSPLIAGNRNKSIGIPKPHGTTHVILRALARRISLSSRHSEECNDEESLVRDPSLRSG